VPGPQIEVVGVGQNDLGAGVPQVVRRDGLNRPLGSHWHKNRGIEASVLRFDFTEPAPAFPGLMN